ncbi:hypothetical protein F0562_028483 [Nyssa sinensis]|uniref:DUF7792 domain-containing protein n=1 Tax=Nyssa sinensis TaxID=561372 RepID=A0A5J5AY45_9ASTE|nr:hypothetical protein F0562_028483 [Nyssa sinensis]
MADIVKQILATPIQLADTVTKAADDVNSFKQECSEIKAKTEKLAVILRQAARASNDLYERPTRRIIDDTQQVIEKALALIFKCRANGFKRVFTIIPTAAFRKTTQQLENSIGDVSWLLRVSTPANDRDDEYLGLPPIAANEPILCLIWEQIAILCSGSIEDRSDAAASLVSLARDNDRYGKLIIEEGGVAPLLKLAKEGRMEGQENAARAIGLLGRDPESVEHIVNAGVCSVFAKILKEGHMTIQVVVAWAVSELAAHHPKCRDHFAQNNTIRLLVGHLAFETIQEHSKYAIASKQTMSIHNVVMANSNTNNSNNNKQDDDDKQLTGHSARPTGKETPNQMHNLVTNTMAMKTQSKETPQHSHASNQANHSKNVKSNHDNHQYQQHQQRVSLIGTSIRGREFEDPATKAQMKAMAARALRHLCTGNVSICKSITESRALLCFAVLLEKGPDEVQYNSAMALMEITAVAEQNSELRRSAFKPTSPAAKAVVDQLLRIIDKEDSDLLIPCIKAMGNLARTFRATEKRIVAPLVRLLDEREADVSGEAVIALNKFACTDNFLHVNHSKDIIEAGDSEVLAQEEVLTVLEWGSKQGSFMQDPSVETLLFEAESRLELYQSRGSRGFH